MDKLKLIRKILHDRDFIFRYGFPNNNYEIDLTLQKYNIRYQDYYYYHKDIEHFTLIKTFYESIKPLLLPSRNEIKCLKVWYNYFCDLDLFDREVFNLIGSYLLPLLWEPENYEKLHELLAVRCWFCTFDVDTWSHRTIL